MKDCIVSSLTTCSGQELVVQREMMEKECVVEDIRNKSSHRVGVGPLKGLVGGGIRN